jgi:hypothetical protein
MEEPLEEPVEPPIAQKEKKPRSPAQIEAFQKARDKRLLLASQKKIDEAKRIESGVKTTKPKPAPAPKPVEPAVAEEEEEEVRVVKKPKKKRIIYVESDSEEELVVKRKGEKKELPPPPPPVEPIKLPPAKSKPLIVFL